MGNNDLTRLTRWVVPGWLAIMSFYGFVIVDILFYVEGSGKPQHYLCRFLAEWEKAARSPTVRAFPSGDQLPNCTLANFWDIPACVGDTSHVGSYPAGAGNVWEWVNDWYKGNYYSVSPYANPPWPATGTYKVLRAARGATIESRLQPVLLPRSG